MFCQIVNATDWKAAHSIPQTLQLTLVYVYNPRMLGQRFAHPRTHSQCGDHLKRWAACVTFFYDVIHLQGKWTAAFFFKKASAPCLMKAGSVCTNTCHTDSCQSLLQQFLLSPRSQLSVAVQVMSCFCVTYMAERGLCMFISMHPCAQACLETLTSLHFKSLFAGTCIVISTALRQDTPISVTFFF